MLMCCAVDMPDKEWARYCIYIHTYIIICCAVDMSDKDWESSIPNTVRVLRGFAKVAKDLRDDDELIRAVRQVCVYVFIHV
jgi:hypothetical protein